MTEDRLKMQEENQEPAKQEEEEEVETHFMLYCMHLYSRLHHGIC